MHLPSTFLHIKGISPKKELELWNKGIVSWDALEATLNPQASLFEDQSSGVDTRSALVQSRQALQEGNADFFSNQLPPPEYYRIALTFPSNTLFIDIETTGLSRYYDYITVIGWSIGGEYGVYVKGGDAAPLKAAIKRAKAIVTFNGTLFDLPFIKHEFPNLVMPKAHIDLRFFLKRRGLSGGQKSIEQQLGLVREAEVQGLDGEAAPILWHKYRRGDLDALKMLIEYNHADIEGMKFIFDKGIERLATQVRWPNAKKTRGVFSKLQSKVTWRKAGSGYTVGKTQIMPYRDKITPFITMSDLIDTNADQKLRVVGIDLCGSESKLTGWCFLNGRHAMTKGIATDDELVSETLRVKPHVVSIDSPLSLPAGRTSVYDDDPGRHEYGIMRYSERVLKKRGVNVYPALIPSMQRLTARGINLAKRFRELGIPVIESYPGAAQDIMNIPRKRAGLEFLKDGLAEFGVEGDFLREQVSHDELDAITSAIVGVFFWSGMFEKLGQESDPEEGLFIPDLRVNPENWRKRTVIGLSGLLAAGKTTTAEYFKARGYHYGRYSQVVAEILKERGGKATREALQNLGEELHNHPGQRWLGHQLISRLPKEGDIVIDGIRFPEDRALLIETFGPAFYQVHLLASPDIRKNRFEQRDATSIPFEEAEAHHVESSIESLFELSDASIRNEDDLENLENEIGKLFVSK
ncbi:MAG TPA: ribonuclease H-like domain-containing protein [Gallionella sp.]|nr:ribonuclease H-like domain-containing protein [Gallionella sp.]